VSRVTFTGFAFFLSSDIRFVVVRITKYPRNATFRKREINCVHCC
jgi:hypothetical protein